MPSLSTLTASNSNVELEGSERAVVSGGTQGVGAGIALRFALAGASVWIVGRSEQRAAAMLEKLNAASEEAQRRRKQNAALQSKTLEADHAFFRADLSDMKEVHRVAAEIKGRAGERGIDWLFESQGSPPPLSSKKLPSGLDAHFAVQCLSRFALADTLLDTRTIKRGVCMIAAPGMGAKTPLDVDDLDLSKAREAGKLWLPLGLLRMGQRDSSLLDAVSQKWAEENPNMVFSHLFPGMVATDAAKNAGFPFPLPQIFKIVQKLPYITSSPLPGGYAEVPFYLYANPEGMRFQRTGEANLYPPALKRLSLSANVTTKEARQTIYDKLKELEMHESTHPPPS